MSAPSGSQVTPSQNIVQVYDTDDEAELAKEPIIIQGSTVAIDERGDLHLSIGNPEKPDAIFIVDSRAIFRTSTEWRSMALQIQLPNGNIRFLLHIPGDHRIMALNTILEIAHTKFALGPKFLPPLLRLARMLDIINEYRVTGLDHMYKGWWERHQRKLEASYPWDAETAITALRCAWEAKDRNYFAHVAKFIAWHCHTRFSLVERRQGGDGPILHLKCGDQGARVSNNALVCMTDIEDAIQAYRTYVLRTIINMLHKVVNQLTTGRAGSKRKRRTTLPHTCVADSEQKQCSAYTLGLLTQRLHACMLWPMPPAETYPYHASLEDLYQKLSTQVHGAIASEISFHSRSRRLVGKCSPTTAVMARLDEFRKSHAIELTDYQWSYFEPGKPREDVKAEDEDVKPTII